MAVSREPKARSSSRKGPVGLVAIGSSGPWELAIDRTTSGPDRWFAQVEGPSVYIYFEIPSAAMIDKALEFLAPFQGQGEPNAARTAHDGTFALGSGKSMQVNLLRDDEFSDRYFVDIKPKGGMLVRFTVAGDDLTHIIDALRQAKEDLE